LTLVSGIDLLTGMLFTKNSLLPPVNWVEKGMRGMRLYHKLGDENVCPYNIFTAIEQEMLNFVTILQSKSIQRLLCCNF